MHNSLASRPDDAVPDEAWLPDEEDVARYERDGWFIAPPVLPHALLDSVRAAIELYHTGARDRSLPRRARFSDWRPGDPEGVRNNEFCSLQSDGVRQLVEHPAIGAIAARLARSPAVRLFDDQAIYKPAARGDVGTTAVGWHTDHSYWSTCTSQSMLTAWIPLHDSPVENGTLYVVTGSHLWPECEHLRGFNDPDLEGIAQRMGRSVPKELITPMVLKKGQVSFHHMRALHASAPNRQATPRFAVAVHMQDASNAWEPFTTPAGVQIVLPHDELCRSDANGRPDYADPAVFPQLWPQAAART